ncbi:MAG: hypothetical protein WD673_07095 [Alphaproteobacteria bacterium]
MRSVSDPYASSQDPVAVLRYLERGPDVRAVVVGNPTPAPDATFVDAVTTAMNDRPWGPRVNFTATPQHEASPGYHVVAVFGVADPIGGYALCSASPEALSAAPSSGELQAAFCWRDRPISRTRVSVGAITAADDPRLHLAVRTAMRQLFPLRRQQELDRDPCFPFRSCAGIGFGLPFSG